MAPNLVHPFGVQRIRSMLVKLQRWWKTALKYKTSSLGRLHVQPCMTAYCIQHNTYDPGISPGSANQCIFGDVYLRSNLSRKA